MLSTATPVSSHTANAIAPARRGRSPPPGVAAVERGQRRRQRRQHGQRPEHERRPELDPDQRAVAPPAGAEQAVDPRRIVAERDGDAVPQAIDAVEHERRRSRCCRRSSRSATAAAERGQRGDGDPARPTTRPRRTPPPGASAPAAPGRHRAAPATASRASAGRTMSASKQLDVEGEAQHRAGGDQRPRARGLRPRTTSHARQHVERHHHRVHRVAARGEDRDRQDRQRGRRAQPGDAAEERGAPGRRAAGPRRSRPAPRAGAARSRAEAEAA